jgi:hypothetical protein
MILTYIQSLKAIWVGLAVLLLVSLPVFGSTITVTNTNDRGAGSKPNAIASAAHGDTINFSLTYPATITVLTPLTLGPSVTVTGPGASDLTISGGSSVVVLIINAGGIVAISGLSIEEGGSLLGGGIFNAGVLTLNNSTVSNNATGTQLGGGIFNAGVLTLISSTVSNNVVNNLSAAVNGQGGGIYNINPTAGSGDDGGCCIFVISDASPTAGTLTLINSTVSNNLAFSTGTEYITGTGSAAGGGIFNEQGTVTLINSTVSGNTVSGATSASGGGIVNDSGTVTLNNSTVSGNTVCCASNGGENGGGISNNYALNITNSTVSGNKTDSLGSGGGISNANSGVVILSNSTVSGNVGGSQTRISGGGGITNVGSLTVKNSIVASNTGGNCNVVAAEPGSNISNGHNLSDDGSCASFFIQTGDLNDTPSGLDSAGLKNNGGPTQTIALVSSTAASVNSIPLTPTNYCTDVSGNPVTSDQRGVTRPQRGACDIGAVEGTFSVHFGPRPTPGSNRHH